MSRLTDRLIPENVIEMPPLPVVDWKRIANKAPEVLNFEYKGPEASLPLSDIVIITWTNAEWSAFDHVFCNSNQSRTSKETAWRSDWKAYSKGAPPPPVTGVDYHLWGYYRMVNITVKSNKVLKVLLFKAQAHLAYDPYLAGLLEMTNAILADTRATYLFSIGTAGGVGDGDLLGNTVITNCGYLDMTNGNNSNSPLNNKTFSCTNWFPSFELMVPVQQQLLYPLSNVANWNQYNNLFVQLQNKINNNGNPLASMDGITVDDLVNAPLDPARLHQPQTYNCKDKPLLTTDFYYIAKPGDSAKYCILEMDDAVLGAAASEKGINFVFVRNVSDPVVPSQTRKCVAINDEIRNNWSSLIYETFGFYTSYNGALSTWAAIVAM